MAHVSVSLCGAQANRNLGGTASRPLVPSEWVFLILAEVLSTMSHNGSSPAQAELDVMRHSAAHVLAKAVQQLYPGSKLGIGPVIDNGFYYDIDTSENISEADLPRIEATMREHGLQKK